MSKHAYKHYIFVVESGWVFYCDTYTETATAYDLQKASVIRVWGTTNGLGEIALQGVTKNTVLDACGTPQIPKDKLLFILPCTC